jgi:hypothetical protein
VRGLSNTPRISFRVSHDLNNKPIRKFHTDLLDETVKLERTSAFRIVLPPSTEALRPSLSGSAVQKLRRR